MCCVVLVVCCLCVTCFSGSPCTQHYKPSSLPYPNTHIYTPKHLFYHIVCFLYKLVNKRSDTEFEFKKYQRVNPIFFLLYTGHVRTGVCAHRPHNHALNTTNRPPFLTQTHTVYIPKHLFYISYVFRYTG